MRKFARLLVFLMAFQLEVRVRAEVVTLPEACHSKQSCAYSVFEKSETLKISCGHVQASQGSVMISHPEGCEFVRGAVFIGDLQAPFQILQGQVSSEGSFLVFKQDEKIYLQAIDKPLTVGLRDGEKFNLVPGFRVWLGKLDAAKKIERAVPQEIKYETYKSWLGESFQEWQPVLALSDKELQELWSHNHELASAQYRDEVTRQIASSNQKKQEEAERIRRRMEEQARLKRDFYDRVFGR